MITYNNEYFEDIKEITTELAPFGINVITKFSSEIPNDFIVVIPKESKCKKGTAYIRGGKAEKLASDTIKRVMEKRYKTFNIIFITDDSEWSKDNKAAIIEKIENM